MRTLRIMGVLGATAVLLSAGVAFAEEGRTNIASNAGTRVEVKDTTRVNMETARKEAKTKMETAREEAKTRMETAREEAKVRIEAVREDAKAKMESQREKAGKRLDDIRDKSKKQMAEKIAEQLEKLNKKWTDHFVQSLERYDAIILKIQERADIAATNGKGITLVSAAIKSANTAIESARTAVIAQAAKTYALDASSITTTTATTTTSGQDELMKGLRTQFQNLHKTLFKDLFALRDGVMKDAKRAIQDALKTLGNVPNVDEENATSTDKSNQ